MEWRHSHWHSRSQDIRHDLLTITMSDNDQEIYQRWLQATLSRIANHEFRDKARIGRRSACKVFLEAVFKLHYRNNRYNCIPPPLPGLPALPLHDQSSGIHLKKEGARAKSYRTVDSSLYRREYDWPLESQDLLQAIDRYVIVAGPGAGKSTLLAWSARYMIREAGIPSLIPLYVPLKWYGEWLRGDRKASIYRYYWESMLKLPRNVSEDFESFMNDVENGRGKLRNLVRPLLDGWDEVRADSRQAVADFLDRVEHAMPGIVTTRPEGYTAELQNWNLLNILPLNPELVAKIVRDWFGVQGDRKGEELLYRHICEDYEVRELATNPCLLTVLCAVASAPSQQKSSEKREYPSTRTKLYRSAIDLMSKQFHYRFGADAGDSATLSMTEIEDFACDLLLSEKESPYVFEPSRVRKLAEGSGGQLVCAWKRARVVALAELFGERLAFVHRTIQEYLAAQAIVRRIEAGQLEIDAIALRASLFGVMRFAFGSVGSEGGERLWAWLAKQCREADRFGLVLIKAAYFLAEAGQRDGGKAKLGFSILPALFSSFLRAPKHERYAEALLTLDPRFAMESVGLSGDVPESRYERLRVMSAYALQQDVYTFREKYPYQRIMYLRSSGRRPDEASSGSHTVVYESPRWTECKDSRRATEIIHDLEEARDKNTRVRLWRELQLTQTRSAEAYLIAEYERCSLDDFPELFWVIGGMRQEARRAVLLRSLERFEENTDILRKVLDALGRVGVDRDGAKLLRFLEPQWPDTVRLAAAEAMSRVRLDESDLERLAEYVRLTETAPTLRRSVWWALAKARHVGVVQELLLEGFSQRDSCEMVAIWKYLESATRQLQETRAYDECLGQIEGLFLQELTTVQNPHPAALIGATLFRDSERLRLALETFVFDNTRAASIRVAVLRGLNEMGTFPSEEKLMHLLRQEVEENGASDLVEVCAATIARIAPEYLLAETMVAARIALWEMSLTTGNLVYEDRIVDPDRGESKARLPVKVLADESKRETSVKKKGGRVKHAGEHRGRRYIWGTKQYLELFDWFKNPDNRETAWQQDDINVLSEAWGECMNCSDALRRGYMFAAAFCRLLQETFPVEEHTWGYTPERISSLKKCLEDPEEWGKAKKIKKIEKAPSIRRIFKIGHEAILPHRELVRLFRLTCAAKDMDEDKAREAEALLVAYRRANTFGKAVARSPRSAVRQDGPR